MKTRMALRRTGEVRGIADLCRKLYAREGLRGFYRGYIPNLMGILPYAGIDLTVYETLKNHYQVRQANQAKFSRNKVNSGPKTSDCLNHFEQKNSSCIF